jgi:hypothetical protein
MALESAMNKGKLADLENEEIPKHISKTDKLALHKDPKLCPICTAKLEKIGQGTRRKNQCASCNAVLAKELKCTRCGTNRVWRGTKGKYCHGCGHAQT